MHQLGSTDPSYFPLVDPLEPASYEGGEGLPGSGALGEQVPWGGRPGGSSNKLLGNDRQRLEFSLHQVQPDQFAKHCVWLVTILAVDVSPSCSTAAQRSSAVGPCHGGTGLVAILGPPARKGLSQLENPPPLHALLLSNTGSTSQGLAWEPCQEMPPAFLPPL